MRTRILRAPTLHWVICGDIANRPILVGVHILFCFFSWKQKRGKLHSKSRRTRSIGRELLSVTNSVAFPSHFAVCTFPQLRKKKGKHAKTRPITSFFVLFFTHRAICTSIAWTSRSTLQPCAVFCGLRYSRVDIRCVLEMRVYSCRCVYSEFTARFLAERPWPRNNNNKKKSCLDGSVV